MYLITYYNKNWRNIKKSERKKEGKGIEIIFCDHWKEIFFIKFKKLFLFCEVEENIYIFIEKKSLYSNVDKYRERQKEREREEIKIWENCGRKWKKKFYDALH